MKNVSRNIEIFLGALLIISMLVLLSSIFNTDLDIKDIFIRLVIFIINMIAFMVYYKYSDNFKRFLEKED